jgi:hypothetical protein
MRVISIYRICLADYEVVLPEIATAIGATYLPDSFSNVIDAFEDNNQSTQEWSLLGTNGCKLVVLLEQYEGYFFSVLHGSGAGYVAAKQLLWDAYISQGGNPDAQERP